MAQMTWLDSRPAMSITPSQPPSSAAVASVARTADRISCSRSRTLRWLNQAATSERSCLWRGGAVGAGGVPPPRAAPRAQQHAAGRAEQLVIPVGGAYIVIPGQ